jgi:hypothetical protein
MTDTADIERKAKAALAWMRTTHGRHELSLMDGKYGGTDAHNIVYAITRVAVVPTAEEMVEIVDEVRRMRHREAVGRRSLVAAFLATSLVLSSCVPRAPLVYITYTAKIPGVNGDAYTLRYAVNGIACVEFFDSPQRRAEYVEYLGLVGRVKE